MTSGDLVFIDDPCDSFYFCPFFVDKSEVEWLTRVLLWYKMGISGEKWWKCLSYYFTHNNSIVASFGVNILRSLSMFIGEYSHNLDEKGRLAIPVKFRHELAGGAVVTRGLDNCLFLFTKTEWEKLAEKLANLPMSQAQARAFARLMLAGAMDVEVDKQGRIIIPEYLRTFAGLSKEVVLAGLYNRLELWGKEQWEVYKKQTESESAAIAENMAALGV